MTDDKKDTVKKDDQEKEQVAPVDVITASAEKNAAAQVGEDSEVKPVEGFFLTSQRWH
jgi:hypothetical protein